MPRRSRHLVLDRPLLVTTLILLVLGVIFVYDASVVYSHSLFGGKYRFLILQSFWVVFGLIGLAATSFWDYRRWGALARPFFWGAVALLVFILLPLPFSPQVYGARRWLILNPEPLPLVPLLGRISFQPSDLAKLASIIFFAGIFSRKNYRLTQLILPVAAVLLPILLEPDLGTALVIFLILLIIYFASGAPWWHFFLGLPAAAAAFLLAIVVSPYRHQRLLTFLRPEASDLQSAGYHTQQILIALGSGGLWGLGFGRSRQKYEYLPEVIGDSIFAVIGEELGFVGAVLVMSLLVLLIFRGLKIAQEAKDKFGQLVAVGITAWLGVQTFVNLFAMVRLIPLTGIPLPLISYGGSSMIFGLTALGILLNVSKRRV